MQLLRLTLYPLLIALPALAVFWLWRKSNQQEKKEWSAFIAQLARIGINIDPSSKHDEWRATGSYRSLPITLKTSIRESDNDDEPNIYRIRIKIAQEREMAPTIIYRASLPPPESLTPGDALAAKFIPTEDRFFDQEFRCVCPEPEQLRQWLSTEARKAMMALSELVCVAVKDGYFEMEVDNHSPCAARVDHYLDLLTALYQRRPLAIKPVVGRWRSRWTERWGIPALLPPFFAAILAIVVPVAWTGMWDLASPLMCDQGALSPKRHEGYSLYCRVDARTEQGPVDFVLPSLLFFNAFYWPLVGSLSLSTGLRLRRRARTVAARYRQGGGGPYR